MVPRLRALLGLACLLGAIACASTAVAAWPTFHGDLWRRGDARVEVIIPTLSARPPSLRGKHRIGVGAGLSAVLADVTGDRKLEVIVGASDNSIHCLDSSGSLLWKASARGPVLAAPAVAFVQKNQRPTLFFADLEGYLFACDGEGRLRWQCRVGGRIVSSPAVADLRGKGNLEVIVGTSAGEVVSVSADTGKVLWRYSTNEAVEASPSLADLDGDGKMEVIVGARNGFLYCLRSDGRLRWKFRTGGDIMGAAAVAFLSGPHDLSVLVGSGDGHLYCLNPNGKQRWNWRAGAAINSTPAVADLRGDGTLRIVFGTADGRAVCLDSRGQHLWSFTAEKDYEIYSSPVAADLDGDGIQEIYFGSYDGTIYQLAPDGRPLWRYKAQGGVEATAAVADVDLDGTPEFIIGSLDGYLYFFGASPSFPRESPPPPLLNPEWRTLASDRYVADIKVDGPSVWIAAGGILLYDSKSGRYTRFGPEHGLAEASPTCIAIGTNEVWIGTKHAGLSRFDKATGRWQTFTKKDGLTGNSVTAVAADGERVWVGGLGTGLGVYHVPGKEWRSYSTADGLPDASVSALAVGQGDLWVGTSNGVGRLNQSTGRWEKYGPADGLPHPSVTALSVTEDQVWVATEDAIARFDRKENRWRRIDSPSDMGKPISLLAGKDRLLVGTEQGVLELGMDTLTWRAVPGLPAGKAVSSLAKQNQFHWAGTLGDGLYCLDLQGERWAQSRSTRLPSSGVNAIAWRGSEVWMATGGGVRDWRGGVSRLDRRTGEWQTWMGRDGISHWAVNAIALDGERVWIATRGGLNLFLPRTGRWRTWGVEQGLKDPFVVSLAVGLGRVWFGTDRAGAGYLDPKTRKIHFLHPPHGWGPRAVEAIVVHGGRVWFTCWDGVRWYHPPSGKWGALRVADGIVHPVVWAIGMERDSLWLGTSMGLSRLSKAKGKFETFDRTRGLPDDFVWAMAFDEESLYFGTQAGGVAEFRKRDSDWHVINSSHGLASDEVYCVTLAKDKTVAGKGELWVGTYGGVSWRVRQ